MQSAQAHGKFTVKMFAVVICLFLFPHPESTGQEKKFSTEIIKEQERPRISARLMQKVRPDNTRILVSLSTQRAYLMIEDEVVIDTPISSGRQAGMTPQGDFTVLEKSMDYRSPIYGNFVDSKGRVLRSGVSTRIDAAPSGTRFVGAPMWYFIRATAEGIGLHVGNLPGYPGSHGTVRLPEEIAPLFYQNVKIGTPIKIVQ